MLVQSYRWYWLCLYCCSLQSKLIQSTFFWECLSQCANITCRSGEFPYRIHLPIASHFHLFSFFLLIHRQQKIIRTCHWIKFIHKIHWQCPKNATMAFQRLTKTITRTQSLIRITRKDLSLHLGRQSTWIMHLKNNSRDSLTDL